MRIISSIANNNGRAGSNIRNGKGLLALVVQYCDCAILYIVVIHCNQSVIQRLEIGCCGHATLDNVSAGRVQIRISGASRDEFLIAVFNDTITIHGQGHIISIIIGNNRLLLCAQLNVLSLRDDLVPVRRVFRGVTGRHVRNGTGGICRCTDGDGVVFHRHRVLTNGNGACMDHACAIAKGQAGCRRYRRAIAQGHSFFCDFADRGIGANGNSIVSGDEGSVC